MVDPVALRVVLSRQIEGILTAPTVGSHLPMPEELWAAELARLPTDRGLKRVRGLDAVLYQWAIAPRLSRILALSPETIAQTLVAVFSQSMGLSRQCQVGTLASNHLWANCEVQVWSSQLLQIAVGDRALAYWLEETIPGTTAPQMVADPILPPGAAANLPEDPFFLQVAHARCCSLLRLGAREGLITLAPPDGGVPQAILAPCPLPWLTAEGQLRLPHRMERQLLSQVLHSLDGLEEGSDRAPAALWTQAVALGHSFHAFEAACRLLGQVKAEDPQLAQVRLGLIFLTRYGLGRLLGRFGLGAPLEL